MKPKKISHQAWVKKNKDDLQRALWEAHAHTNETIKSIDERYPSLAKYIHSLQDFRNKCVELHNQLYDL